MAGVFHNALASMAATGSSSFGPASFRGYIDEHRLKMHETAAAISVDGLNRLDPELAAHGVMVFRLGRFAGTRHTAFALHRCREGWADFFFDDAVLFGDRDPQTFTSTRSRQAIAAFQYLPRLTETSVVNLAAASGLLSVALGLDDTDECLIPATGQSTYTFDVRPYADTFPWSHVAGQVEIDALWFAKRRGQKTLFLVEAKCTPNFESLAKHKLVYPYLALRTTVPTQTPIVPVYLRALRRKNAWDFFICECELHQPSLSAVASLLPTERICAMRVLL